jgi:hypothetical protein
MTELQKYKDYELIQAIHGMTEEINWLNADLESEKEFVELQAEIERRGIKLTKGIVKRWWYRHCKGLKGRMQWQKPRGYNNHWDNDVVAVYKHGTLAIVYHSLAAVVSDIGELDWTES